MALTIQTEKGIFDLPQDFSVEIENTSPMYTDKGSQTIASTLPATGHNLSMVDYIHRPDIRNAPKRDAAAVVTDGVYRRTGKLNITSVSTESGIVCNIGFDESIMYEAWKNVSLKKGENRIEASGKKGTVELTDQCKWVLLDKKK